MGVPIIQQTDLETEEMFSSYPKYQNHIYDTRNTEERVMSIIDIDGGSEYETDGRTYLIRKEQTAGYRVTLHFSESQSDIGSVVQRILSDEFMKELKRE